MPEQSPNGPATAVNEGAIYTKQGTGSATQLFWRPENQLAAGTEVQMTGPTPSSANPGYTFLPGGILMQWGRLSGFNSGDTITWPIAFSTFYTCTLSRRETSDQRGYVQFDSSSGPSATGAKVIVRDSNGSEINNQRIFYIAIGAI